MMIPTAITRHKYLLATSLLLIILIVCMWPFLSLPYYWDEAWVYGKGVRIMCMEGPGMLPTSVPVDISRGHPLLFYFLGGLWLKISGNTIFSSHLFALAISVVLVFAVFRLCADFLSKRLAFFVTALLMLQPIFLGQSCLVLPEMMLALWTVLALRAFYSGKKLLFVLFGALLLLTKESGLVCIAAIGLNELLFDLFGRNERGLRIAFKNWRTYLLICFPVLIASVHFFIQKIIYGWFFFPEHLGYISFSWNELSHKFIKYFSFLCIFDGRNALFFGGMLALIILIARRKIHEAVDDKTKQLLSCLGIFIFLFLCFSSVNFYCNRYVMCLVPPLIILSVYAMDAVLRKPAFKWSLFVVLFATGFYYSLNVRTNGDHNPGYADYVRLYKNTIDYCVKEGYAKKKLMAGFLMQNVMTDTLPGYVDGKTVFTNVHSRFDPEVELCIFSSLEKDPYSDSIKHQIKTTPVKTFKWKNDSIQIVEVVR